MRSRSFTLAYAVMLMLGTAGVALAQSNPAQGNPAQDNAAQQPSAQQQLQHIHSPQSIDQELARLTKDLELTPEQQKQVRPLLDEHHDAETDPRPFHDAAAKFHAVVAEASGNQPLS